ncbi:MAG: ABC transporter ATP-binding protein [Rhodospirillales bacterium]|nr:ABC transporter ATP-binding protein [Rhodospirillales bacterium]
MSLVEVEGLQVDFGSPRHPLRAVEDFSLTVDEGEVIGLVGESGSGKSVSMLALMGLIGWPGRVTARRLRFAGADLDILSQRQRRRMLGRDMAMVFQEPTASLNPCFSIGYQIAETLAVHTHLPRRQRRRRVIELLRQVGIAAPEDRFGAFPHQLSGGMNQRVMIAMALACQPRLLICDEPTTALDVTVQSQILDLLLSLKQDIGMAMILVTHDLGVIARMARRVMVMYAGRVIEERPTAELLERPRHPYSQALLDALPERVATRGRLAAIPGTVPGLADRPSGCAFHPRCRYAGALCRSRMPMLDDDASGRVSCHTPLNSGGEP